MRLLHVSHQYRPAIGGSEKYITDLSEELVRRGHQVDVFTSRAVDYQTWRSELPRFEQLAGVNVHRYDSWPRTARAWQRMAYGFRNYWRTGARRYEPYIFFGSGPICPAMFLDLVRCAPRYDIMHINNLHYSHAYTAYRAARLRHVPIVITPHVHAEQRETHDIGYLHTVLRGSDAIVADTASEKDYLLSRGWNDQVTVGGVGLQLDQFPLLDANCCRAQFGLPANACVILFMGRKVDYKGLAVCVEAFAAIRQTRSDICLLAVGPETDWSQQLWARYAGLEGLVVRDRVSDEERLAALAASDALVLPSTGEAFGIVYLEAWAYRKPVIGARITAVASLVSDGTDGFLIEPGDAEALALHITTLADQPQLAQAMGERGRIKLERRYTLSHIADIVEGTYARVLRRRAVSKGRQHAS